MEDEFYIGWEGKSAERVGRRTRRIAALVALIIPIAAVVLAASQRLIGASVFEWGNYKTVTGILKTSPYPHLLVPRPGKLNATSEFSSYYLVAPWKFGLGEKALAPFADKPVSVKGTLIYRGNQTMIETKPEWIVLSTNYATRVQPEARMLGKQTLVGEIVDCKCFLGVMNPGQLTPHRACAIRCISGGVPPVLLVRQKDGPAIYLLLMSAEGKPVNKQVLDMVAEPVEITGEVERQGDLMILRSDPETYRRLK